MPEVKDKITGKIIAKMSYDSDGKEAAEKMVAENPQYEIKDGAMRSQTIYAGGGETGYNSIGTPMYEKGGEVSESLENKELPPLRLPLYWDEYEAYGDLTQDYETSYGDWVTTRTGGTIDKISGLTSEMLEEIYNRPDYKYKKDKSLKKGKGPSKKLPKRTKK